jgi:hypothetical protein
MQVLLSALCCLLLTAFILFDSDFSSTVIENRLIFTVLSAMLVVVLRVLQDISNPDEGLYSVRDAMENRLTYVRWQMENILRDPAIKISILGKDGALLLQLYLKKERTGIRILEIRCNKHDNNTRNR